jgi:hypothetical protein
MVLRRCMLLRSISRCLAAMSVHKLFIVSPYRLSEPSKFENGTNRGNSFNISKPNNL